MDLALRINKSVCLHLRQLPLFQAGFQRLSLAFPTFSQKERTLRIAILEDDPDQMALLKHWLSETGHDLHCHLTGNEMIKYAGRESFDLFVLDWQVPDVSGADVLRWIRANVSKSTPVLFVTVRDAEEDIVFALNSGADDYMVK